jgi:hypothetical protein
VKNTAVVLLCILLFLSLSTFGFAFTVHRIALSPGFVTGTLDSIDFSKAANDILQSSEMSSEINISHQLQIAIIDNLDSVEPVLKDKINIAVKDIYAYMLGKSSARDFKSALDDSFMNPDSVNAILQKIDLAQLVDAILTEQITSPSPEDEDLLNSIVSATNKLEPTIKQGLVNASSPVFKYALGESQSIDLKTILRQNIINQAFITELANALDIKSIAKNLLDDQLDLALPLGITLNNSEIDQIIVAIEPAIRTGLISAADPIADYLIGIRPEFTITIPCTDALPSIKPVVKQAFLRQLPSELVGASQAQINTAFDVYWAMAQNSIPTTFTIDSSTFAGDLPSTINDMVTSGESALTDVRMNIDDASTSLAQGRDESHPYISMAQFLFWSLVALTLLVIGAVIILRRSVKGSTRDLGITFTAYGVMSLVGVLVFRVFLGRPTFIQGLTNNEIPDYLWDIVSPIVQRLTQPLFIFTLICLFIGIVLLVVYFVYPKRQAPPDTPQPQVPQS